MPTAKRGMSPVGDGEEHHRDEVVWMRMGCETSHVALVLVCSIIYQGDGGTIVAYKMAAIDNLRLRRDLGAFGVRGRSLHLDRCPSSLWSH